MTNTLDYQTNLYIAPECFNKFDTIKQEHIFAVTVYIILVQKCEKF